MALIGTIHTIPSEINKPGYIIYTSPDLFHGKDSRATPNLKDPNNNRPKHILYWPYDAKGNTYNFKKDDVVQFKIKKMILNRMGANFKISVATNLKAPKIILL